MKKIMLLAGALLIVGASAARADFVGSGWGFCDGNGGTQTTTFDCTTVNTGVGQEYDLFHTFTLTTAYPGVIACQAIVTFTFPTMANVPDFWKMAVGGCNDGGIDMAYNRPTGVCASGGTLFCGTAAALCSGSGVAGESYGWGAPNKIRSLVLIARPSTSPVNLTTAKQFLWELRFYMDNPGGLPTQNCAGCDAPVNITLDQLDIFDNINGTRSVTGVDVGSNPTACANATVCDVIATQSKTWGQLKALYR